MLRLVLPEALEARRRQLSIADRVLDVAVPEVGLKGAGIDSLIGQLIPAGVAQHVRVDREIEVGRDAKPGNQLAEAGSSEGRSSLRRENKRRNRLLITLEPTQRPQLAT